VLACVTEWPGSAPQREDAILGCFQFPVDPKIVVDSAKHPLFAA
jgi:hypothetical protein